MRRENKDATKIDYDNGDNWIADELKPWRESRFKNDSKSKYCFALHVIACCQNLDGTKSKFNCSFSKFAKGDRVKITGHSKPFVGVVYDVTRHLSLYGSFVRIHAENANGDRWITNVQNVVAVP